MPSIKALYVNLGQYYERTDLDSSGNIVVAWASYAQEGETHDDIYYRYLPGK